MRQLLNIFPWLVIIVLLLFYFLGNDAKEPQTEKTISQSTILTQIESLGKLELVKYNFQEITELRKVSQEFLKIFKLGPDSKAVLISSGEAVGCIDLQKIEIADVYINSDTVILQLPPPEICYYKIDLDNTELYSLQTGYFTDDTEFVEEAYQLAEEKVKEAALKSGIIDQTKVNAEIILKPFLQNLTDKTVILKFRQEMDSIERY